MFDLDHNITLTGCGCKIDSTVNGDGDCYENGTCKCKENFNETDRCESCIDTHHLEGNNCEGEHVKIDVHSYLLVTNRL